MNIYIVKLTEKYKPFPKNTFYRYEINGILNDTTELTRASIFDNYPFARDLAEQIENDYDYKATVLHFLQVT